MVRRIWERLSGDSDEVAAREQPRDMRERLVCHGHDADGVIDELVYDYGVDFTGPDDTGAERCEECGEWTVEMISVEHATNCSLHTSNVL